MPEHPTSTLVAVHAGTPEGDRVLRSARIKYVVAIALLAALVLSAVVDGTTGVDIWGVSTARARAAGGGYDLEVRYADVSRPGLATPFDVVVRSDGGFDGPVDLALDPSWLEMWDYQALHPQPSSSAGEPGRVVWTFDAPDGDVLRVFLDARIQASAQSARDGWVAVLDPSGAELVRVDFTTAVRP